RCRRGMVRGYGGFGGACVPVRATPFSKRPAGYPGAHDFCACSTDATTNRAACAAENGKNANNFAEKIKKKEGTYYRARNPRRRDLRASRESGPWWCARKLR